MPYRDEYLWRNMHWVLCAALRWARAFSCALYALILIGDCDTEMGRIIVHITKNLLWTHQISLLPVYIKIIAVA